MELLSWLETRQADLIGDVIKHHRHGEVDPQLPGIALHDVGHHARSFVKLYNGDIVGCIVYEFGRFVLVNDSV